jgi:AcrR family transcriptional regulator
MIAFVTGSHKTSVMPKVYRRPRNKPQARTVVTKAKLLDAAQALFAEQGFENTQLDEVAARAGYSRGAIYAHYSSKEDLFLELMEHRVHTKFAAVRKNMEGEPDVSKRPAIFKRWVASQVCDPSWGTLTLEFKLYAVRRPELREKLLNLYESLFKRAGKDFVEVLFGKGLSKATRIALDRRLAVMSGALGGLVLESHFRPALLPGNHLRQLTEELFEALIHT